MIILPGWPAILAGRAAIQRRVRQGIGGEFSSLHGDLAPGPRRQDRQASRLLRTHVCFALDAINHCDAVVAILDGADVDSGTCIEMGYAKAKGKLVVGVRTDFRAGKTAA